MDSINGPVEERLLGGEETKDLKQRVRRELKVIWQIAFPCMLDRVTSFGILVVTQSFLGHVSELDLAAYALVQTLFIRFFHGIVVSILNKLLLEYTRFLVLTVKICQMGLV